jgi:PAS domain-containing protein
LNDAGSKQIPESKMPQRIAELEKELRAAQEDIATTKEQSNTLRQILKTFNEELGSLLSSSETGAMCLDTDLHIKSATPGIYSHFNIIHSDMGRPITDLVPNLLYDTLEEDVNQVIANKIMKEVVIQSKNGRWFNMRIIPQLKERDTVDSLIITMTDVTNLKKTEGQLRDSGNKLLEAINKSSVVVWHQDMDLRYTWVHNPHPGFKTEEALGKKDEDLLPSIDAANLTSIKCRVLDTGVGTKEKVRTTIKGKLYYYYLSVDPLFDFNSNIIGISCTSTEINKEAFEQSL